MSQPLTGSVTKRTVNGARRVVAESTEVSVFRVELVRL